MKPAVSGMLAAQIPDESFQEEVAFRLTCKDKERSLWKEGTAKMERGELGSGVTAYMED